MNPTGTQLHVITGATGFVGGAILIELLCQTEDHILAIVRPGERSAEERLRATLINLERAYGLGPELLAAAVRRCRAIAGDITAEECGVTEHAVAAYAGCSVQLWHCAASLRYENRYRDEIRATNVDGTRHALALAARLGATAFNYISTAYVAGKRAGLIKEEIFSDIETNNHYEQSKIDAEQLVTESTGMLTRILRPSIVIGHSATLQATTFTGFYGFLRQLVQLKGMIDRAQEGLLTRLQLLMRADPEASLNFVPVDSVARQAVRISQRDLEGRVFHLTHPSPPSVGLSLRTIFRTVGLLEPLLVPTKDEFGWLDKRLDARLDFYGSYIVGQKHFDRRRTDAVLMDWGGADPLLDEARLEAHSRWYLGRLEQERTHMPAAR